MFEKATPLKPLAPQTTKGRPDTYILEATMVEGASPEMKQWITTLQQTVEEEINIEIMLK